MRALHKTCAHLHICLVDFVTLLRLLPPLTVTHAQHMNMTDMCDRYQAGGLFDGRPADFALTKLLFFECHTCSRPYYGGQRQCGADGESPAPHVMTLLCSTDRQGGVREGERAVSARVCLQPCNPGDCLVLCHTFMAQDRFPADTVLHHRYNGCWHRYGLTAHQFEAAIRVQKADRSSDGTVRPAIF